LPKKARMGGIERARRKGRKKRREGNEDRKPRK
jgi:hypothetical protein